MNTIDNLVVDLERKALLLKVKVDALIQEKEILINKNQEIIDQNQHLKAQLEVWKQKYDALKLSNAISGSDESKTEAKIKINALIREIDMCITQLSNR